MFEQRPGTIFYVMNKDKSIFVENLLRRIYQTTDTMVDVVTTSDIQDLLQKHNQFYDIDDINELMQGIGFLSEPIPREADRLWLVKPSETDL